MSIRITCEKCDASYDVQDERAGQVGRCKCGNLIRVPEIAPKAEAPVQDNSNTVHVVCSECKAEYDVPIKPVGPQPEEWANLDTIRSHPCTCGKAILYAIEAKPKQEQSAPKGEFTEVRTASAEEAACAIFEQALPNTPAQDPKWIKIDYQVVETKWGSRQLFEGTEEEIRNIVLQNLRRIGNEPGFDDFTVKVIFDSTIPDGLTSIQISAAFISAGMFVPIRVWKATDKLYACGNSLFAA
jgi:hypothetical protein